MTPKPNMLSAALEYAARGWRVLPGHIVRKDGSCSCRKESCARKGKHPRGVCSCGKAPCPELWDKQKGKARPESERTCTCGARPCPEMSKPSAQRAEGHDCAHRGGLHAASSDPERIRRWWRKWSTTPVCGVHDAALLLDLDTPSGHKADADGVAALAELARKNGELPATPTADTPSGGVHHWFALPADLRLGNGTGDLPAGIDVRGNGAGYALLPPSLHPSGGRYTWREGLSPAEVELAPLPGWLLRLIRPPAPPRKPAPPRRTDWSDAGTEVERIRHALEHIPAEDRDTWIAVGMALQGWGGPEARDLWDEWSRANGASKFDPSDQDRTWGSFNGSNASGQSRGIGSVFALAKRNGWNPREAPGSKSRSKRPRRPGGAPPGEVAPPPGDADAPPGVTPDGTRYDPETGEVTGLPTIQLRAGTLAETAVAAVDALRVADVPIYRRGSKLYRVLVTKDDFDDGAIKRPAGSLTLQPMADSTRWLHLRLGTVAQWTRWDARKQEAVPTDPKLELARSIAETPDVPGATPWPALRGVAAHPVVTPRGRLVSTPGYDPGTGLYLHLAGEWSVPESPTREDAIAACATLQHLLRNFPFVDETDRSVALSLLLTALARPVLPHAPLHGIDAPTPGTGKSLLVDAAGIIATGRKAPVADYGNDDTEFSKRLDGMLLAGDQLIAIDNVERDLYGSALCQTLSQETRRVRPLGSSAMVDVPCGALLVATGNNLTIRADMVRRCIVARLDAKVERPEARQIKQDLLAEVRKRRHELVSCILIVLRAHAIAGRPPADVETVGSTFGEWERWVRFALIWAGEADPAATQARLRDADPAKQETLAVFAAWRKAFGDEGASVATAMKRAEAPGGEVLRDALAAVATRKGKTSPRALGKWLARHKDSVAGGMTLRGEKRANVMHWQIGLIGLIGLDPTRARQVSETNCASLMEREVTNSLGGAPRNRQNRSNRSGEPSRPSLHVLTGGNREEIEL